MSMSNLANQGDNAGAPEFDPSQFKLQPDGTFRISIRGMASMAGVDFSGLARTLRSAVDENPLPCARSLLAQGFCPVDLSSWGETGGIPEAAAPFILEHYGINAASPSARARAVLLAFTRVGINAYLKERLGIPSQPPLTVSEPRLPSTDVLGTVEKSIDLLERLGGLDDRAEHLLRDIVLNHAARSAGGELLLPGARMLALQEAFQELAGAKPDEASKLAHQYGRAFKRLYRDENGRDPKTHKQLVKGRTCDVCDYELDWITRHADELTDALQRFRLK